MSAVSVTITLCTVWPLMSMPRMSVARACASSAPSASLTPPALPRPPTLTCAFTTTLPLSDRAGLLRGLGDAAAQHGQPVPFEQVTPLILEQVHVSPFARDAVRAP